MPEYWKNYIVSYKTTASVFLARKFSNESLHSPAHYHFLICDPSFCADDIHIKLIQYLCTNSKTYKMIFAESELLVAVFWRIQRGFKESQLQHLESLPGESVRFDGEGGRAGDTRTNSYPKMGPDGPGYCVPLMVSGNEMLNINCRLSMHCSFPFRLHGRSPD